MLVQLLIQRLRHFHIKYMNCLDLSVLLSNGKRIKLPSIEWRLLYLLRSVKRIVSKEEVIQKLGFKDDTSIRNIYVYKYRLDIGLGYDFIETVQSMGYKYREIAK